MRQTLYDYNKWLILLCVIKLSGGRCIFRDIIPSLLIISCRKIRNIKTQNESLKLFYPSNPCQDIQREIGSFDSS